PMPFGSAEELLALGEASGKSFAAIMLENELALRPLAEIEAGLDHIAAVMDACIDRGCSMPGTLPGGLKVKRRAPQLQAE
ncbi:L-serine ammonia-lyase, partial [Streptomyces galilaeus]